MVHRDRLTDSEVTRVRDVACTTPLRTAFDLARGPVPARRSSRWTGWPTATASTPIASTI